jgi:hypothetical protein
LWGSGVISTLPRDQPRKRLMDQSLEQWRQIDGYEGFYEVSSAGQVRSVDRVVPHSKLGQWKRRGVTLRKTPVSGGYLAVNLSREGRIKKYRVHALVAEAFLPSRPEWATQINHKNKKVTDNRVENLEWSYSCHNVRHANSKYEYRGRLVCLTELAEMVGLPRSALSKRINELGWSVERAVSTPKREVSGGDGYYLWVM